MYSLVFPVFFFPSCVVHSSLKSYRSLSCDRELHSGNDLNVNTSVAHGLMPATVLRWSLFCVFCFSPYQSDILDGIKKDNYELTADMQKKLSVVCDEFTSSFTG